MIKTSVDEFIKDKYYCLCNSVWNIKYYFKFERTDGSFIYLYNCLIEKNSNGSSTIYSNNHITVEWVYPLIKFEINFLDIIECLPDSNIDKRNYIRKKKINNLLLCK